MRLINRLFVSLLFVFASTSLFARSGYFDWSRVINAIIRVESGGNAKAVNGIYVGILQMSPNVVKECNNILRSRKSSKRFTLNDRYNAQKSKEMFVLFQSQYNPSNNVEKAIRMWHGGANYSVKKTQQYYNRVKRFL